MSLIILSLFFILSSQTAVQAKTELWEDYYKLLYSVSLPIPIDQKLRHTAISYELLNKSRLRKEYIKSQKEKLNSTEIPQSNNEQIAFWINSYNFFTLIEVAENYPVKSMKEIGWDKERHKIAKQTYSLSQIQEKLRTFNDPRIHFAINSASTSSASIKTTPYTAEELNNELNQSTIEALANPLLLEIKKTFWSKDEYISASKIFKWFEKDFQNKSYNSPLAFIHEYAPEKFKELDRLKTNKEFNWKLNTKNNIDAEMHELGIVPKLKHKNAKPIRNHSFW